MRNGDSCCRSFRIRHPSVTVLPLVRCTRHRTNILASNFRGVVLSAAIAAAASSALTSGCTGKAPEGLPEGGGPPLGSYQHVLVHDFRDGVSAADKSTRGVERITMSKVVNQLADRIASDTRALDIFDSVTRKGHPGPHTIIVKGVVTAYRDGNRLSGLPLVGKTFDDSRAFEASVELIDGADGRSMMTFPLDITSRPANSSEYSGILRGPAAAVAAKLYELKIGRAVPSGYYGDAARSEDTAENPSQ